MLTTTAAKAARPRDRAYKLADAHGLHLHVATSGTRSWRLEYRLAGREQLLTLGRFPDIFLAEARAIADDAREAIKRGEKPAASGGAVAESAFEAAARAWYAHQRAAWTPVHAADVIASLKRDVFPVIGSTPLALIDPPMIRR